jgi:hypothetical protein
MFNLNDDTACTVQDTNRQTSAAKSVDWWHFAVMPLASKPPDNRFAEAKIRLAISQSTRARNASNPRYFVRRNRYYTSTTLRESRMAM